MVVEYIIRYRVIMEEARMTSAEITGTPSFGHLRSANFGPRFNDMIDGLYRQLDIDSISLDT